MIQVLKKQFCAFWFDGLWVIGLTAGLGIVGIILYQIILGTDKVDGPYVPLGTIIAAATALIMILALIMSAFGLYFNTEISMGCTRRRFFFSFFFVALVTGMAGYGLVLLVHLLENALNGALHPELTREVEMMPYLLRWGAPAVLLSVVWSMFLATLVLRFGKKAYWLLWAVWMILCIGFPRVVEAIAEAPNSVFGKIGGAAVKLFSGVPSGTWALAAAAACVAGLAGTYWFLRRQQVMN